MPGTMYQLIHPCNPVNCNPFTKQATQILTTMQFIPPRTGSKIHTPNSWTLLHHQCCPKPLPLLASGAALGSRLQHVATVGDALTKLGFDRTPRKALPSLKESSECCPKQLGNWYSSSFSPFTSQGTRHSKELPLLCLYLEIWIGNYLLNSEGPSDSTYSKWNSYFLLQVHSSYVRNFH